MRHPYTAQRPAGVLAPPAPSWCRLRSGESMSRRQRACQRSIGPVAWSAFAPGGQSHRLGLRLQSWRRRARPRPVACATNCARRTGTPTCGCCTASGAMTRPCRRVPGRRRPAGLRRGALASAGGDPGRAGAAFLKPGGRMMRSGVRPSVLASQRPGVTGDWSARSSSMSRCRSEAVAGEPSALTCNTRADGRPRQ